MKIYVYVIYFPTSKRSNPHYIGIAKNLEKRMSQHFSSKYLVGKALDKYDDWIIKKLHTCRTYEEAYKIEIEEIRNFNCAAPNGYNLTRGGDGSNGFKGHKHSLESIEKIRTAQKGNQYGKGKNLGNQNVRGKHWKHSEKTIEKNRRAKIGNRYALKHGRYTKEAKIKRLKTRLVKLEKEN